VKGFVSATETKTPIALSHGILDTVYSLYPRLLTSKQGSKHQSLSEVREALKLSSAKLLNSKLQGQLKMQDG